MSSAAGRALIVALLGVGCADSGGLLTRLTEAWGEQTASEASPSITAALVIGGLAAELCVNQQTGPWIETEPGEAPPVENLLLMAMGDPVVEEAEVYTSGALQVELTGVQIMDRDNAIVRFFTAPGSSSFGFEASVMDGRQGDPQGGSNDPFGRIAFDVQADCAEGRNRVQGTAQWTNLEGRTQKITIPADSELSAGVGFDADVPYLPDSGTVSWTGRMDGMERTVTTYDASELDLVSDDDTGGTDTGETATYDVAPAAVWPAYSGGSEWVSEVKIAIEP